MNNQNNCSVNTNIATKHNIWTLAVPIQRSVQLSTILDDNETYVQLDIHCFSKTFRQVRFTVEEFCAFPIKPIFNFIAYNQLLWQQTIDEGPERGAECLHFDALTEYQVTKDRVIRVGVEKFSDKTSIVRIFEYTSKDQVWELTNNLDLHRRDYFHLKLVFENVCRAALEQDHYFSRQKESQNIPVNDEAQTEEANSSIGVEHEKGEGKEEVVEDKDM